MCPPVWRIRADGLLCTSTPDGPTYEGRLLDRPDEEVVDQGAAFDLGTLFSRRPVTRRAVFGLFGVGAGAALLAAWLREPRQMQAVAAQRV